VTGTSGKHRFLEEKELRAHWDTYVLPRGLWWSHGCKERRKKLNHVFGDDNLPRIKSAVIEDQVQHHHW
jgi:hypothetical protein